MTAKTWPAVALGDLLTLCPDYIDQPEWKLYRKLSVRLYGKGVVLDAPVHGSTLRMRRHQIARRGQVILSEIWGKKGAIGFVPEEGDGALCTSHFFLFDVRGDKIDPRYLQLIFVANYLQEQLDTEAKGTTGYAAVRPKHLLTARIPLPPLDEQRRIVARIEQLAAKIEEARGLRRDAVGAAEAMMKAIASDLLTGTDGAEICSVDSMCDVRGGIQRSAARTPGANPRRYITVAHVQRNRIHTGDPRYFEVSDNELDRWRLLPGDVLVIEGNGSANQIGRTALFRGEIADCVHQNHVIRVRPDLKRVLPEYLNA